jgi:hypothetical protein
MTIENNRLAHQLLSAHLALDPFEELFAEANDAVTGLGAARALAAFFLTKACA